MQQYDILIRGIAPLVTHNARLSDPLNEHTIALASLTGNRKKTPDVHAQVARVEWEGGLYEDGEQIFFPSEALRKSIIESARFEKKGKDIERGVLFPHEKCDFSYDGPDDLDKLYEAGFSYRKSVGVGQSRVIRTRPMFPEGWEVSTTVHINEDLVAPADFLRYVERAGNIVGLGERRPMFGRYELVT